MEKFLKPIQIKTEAVRSGYSFEPLGLIYLMVPFNFPFWLVFKSGIPMLSAGNTVLLRNSDSTPRVAESVEELFKSANFNNGEL